MSHVTDEPGPGPETGITREPTAPHPFAPWQVPSFPGERLPALDLLRGVAILAILPVNMTFFALPMPMGPSANPVPPYWGNLGDRTLDCLTAAFFEGKGVSLLALLFGIGLGLQFDRAAAQGRPFAGYYLWRQFLLFVIGVAHVLALWFGDILAVYALTGCVALLALRVGPTATRVVAWVCYSFTLLAFLGVGILGVVAMAMTPQPAQPTPALTAEGPEAVQWLLRAITPEGQIHIYTQGHPAERVLLRALTYLLFLIVFAVFFGWHVLACFLFGVLLLRTGFFHDPAVRRRWSRRFLLLGLLVGLPVSTALGVLAWLFGSSVGDLVFVAALPMSLLYLTLLVRWVDSGKAVWLRERFQAVGRMALTNYLMQSVIATVVFNTLGYYGTWGPTQWVGLVLGVWLAELVWSSLWLAVFRAGPVEWLWRCAADFRLRPLLRERVPAAATT